ncbi:MAG: DNA replication/repair protein RecF [Candidatus Margulisbacteria bacterium]|nr:DNA replication/repair protein RecF [Candidatus Margulisiibacteriota bacterium]
MLTKCWIKDFRNLKEIVIDFSEDKNLFIYGDNNQGKTNFLEALFFLGNGQSPRDSNILNLISFDKKESILGINIIKPSKPHRIYARISNKGIKSFVLDDKPIYRMSSLFKTIPISYVSSDVIRLFQDSPEERRRCLDRFWSHYNPQYSMLIKKFKIALKQKNKCLELQSNHHQLELWNTQFIKISEIIVQERMKAVSCLNSSLVPLVKKIVEGVSDVSMAYQVKGINRSHFSASDYAMFLAQTCKDNKMKEMNAGRSLYGPQRDDFEIQVDNRSLFSFYSRGINRTVAILLKCAEWDQFKEKTGVYPVLLLDDTFSELDSDMKKKLISLLEIKTQLVYASVMKEDVTLFQQAGMYRMASGVMSRG